MCYIIHVLTEMFAALIETTHDNMVSSIIAYITLMVKTKNIYMKQEHADYLRRKRVHNLRQSDGATNTGIIEAALICSF